MQPGTPSRLLRALIVTLLCFTGYTQAQSAERPIFFLEHGHWSFYQVEKQTGCQMLRELVRQSLLVSAELDYGWIPRDESMEEAEPPAYKGPRLDLHFNYLIHENFKYRVRIEDREQPILLETVPSSGYDVTVYQKVLRDATPQARAALEPLIQIQALPSVSITNATPASYQIGNLDFISLWQQLRDWNSEIRKHGESQQRLAALSRGYATFGLANYNAISHMPKASLARGLVYAQRLVDQHPKESRSYYTRAYAWTLAGFDVFASEDLEKAYALEGAVPDWLPVIQAYRSSDFDRLQQMIEGDDFNSQLAGLLATFATLNGELSARYFEFSDPAIEKNPYNIQLYLMTGRGRMGGVSARGRSTSAAFSALDGLLRSKRSSFANGSKDVNSAIPTSPTNSYTDFYNNFKRGLFYETPPSPPINFPALFTALSQQALEQNDQTPSIESLAHLIRAYRFTIIYQRLKFRKYTWGVDCTEAVAELKPSVASHPYAPLLEAFANDTDVHALAGKVTLGDPSSSLHDMLGEDAFKLPKPKFADIKYWWASMRCWKNYDCNAFDYAYWLDSDGNAKHNSFYLKLILAAKPDHYIGVNYALGDNKLLTDEFVLKHTDLIESSASATRMLGERYSKENRLDDAHDMYMKSLSIEPTRKTTKAIAALCLKQGKREAWLEHMIAAHDFPDHGLERARINHDIAKTLVDLGEWEQALPFAEAGACSYSEWTLQQAAWINALLGNDEQAKELINASALRYDEHPCYVISFYQIFGLDLQSVKVDEVLKSTKARFSASGNNVKLLKAAAIEIFYDHEEAAVALLLRALEISNDPWPGIWAALILEDLGETERRDAVLQSSIECFPKLHNPSNNRKGMHDFLDLYVEINSSPELTEEQLHRLHKFAHAYPNEGFNVEAHYFAGELLRLKKRGDLAKQLLIESLATEERDRIIEFMPARTLRKMGIDPLHELQKKRKITGQGK